jgi:hypothetical protein
MDEAVEYFVIRDADKHISAREFTFINEWIKSEFTFHCILDMPQLRNKLIVDGLWGMKVKGAGKQISQLISNLFTTYASQSFQTSISELLTSILYPLVNDQIMYHDSVFCDTETNKHHIHIEHVNNEERIGQPFSPVMDPVPMKVTKMDIQCK